jgi:hypothetical protein
VIASQQGVAAGNIVALVRARLGLAKRHSAYAPGLVGADDALG